MFVRNGFRCEGRTEVILVADVADLTLQREMSGPIFAGARFAARVADELVGWLDLATDLTGGGTLSRLSGWSEIDTLHVTEAYRRQGVATWLIGHGADWLRLGHADRLITYCNADDSDELAFLAKLGWRELTRTQRGWYPAGHAPGP